MILLALWAFKWEYDSLRLNRTPVPSVFVKTQSATEKFAESMDEGFSSLTMNLTVSPLLTGMGLSNFNSLMAIVWILAANVERAGTKTIPPTKPKKIIAFTIFNILPLLYPLLGTLHPKSHVLDQKLLPGTQSSPPFSTTFLPSYFTGGLTGADGGPGSLPGGGLGIEGVALGAVSPTSNHPELVPEHSLFLLQALMIHTYFLPRDKS